MIAYVDSSVLLRLVLRNLPLNRELAQIEIAISSKLIRVECHRALDRLWLAGELDDGQLQTARREIEKLLEVMQLQDVDDDVIELASHPASTELAPLDALHLATANLYGAGKAATDRLTVFATHEPALANAARELHFQIIGA